MAGIDRRVAGRQERQQRGLPLLEMEGGGEVAVDRYLLDVAEQGAARVAPELALNQQQLEGAGHVLGSERLAVVPFHALAQGEDELLSVRRSPPHLRV